MHKSGLLSHVQAICHSWTSQEQVMNMSRTSHDQVIYKQVVTSKSWKSHEQLVNKSWTIDEQVIKKSRLLSYE